MKSTQLWDIAIKVSLAIAVLMLYLQRMDEGEVMYVDAQRLVVGYKGMQAARKEFENKSIVLKANLDTLGFELEAKIKELNDSKGRLSARELKLMTEVVEVKRNQYVSYQQAIQEKVQKDDVESTKKVLDKVNDFIKRYGKKKGCKIILAATQYGNIVYAEDALDITDEVLEGLNAEYN